MPTKRNHLSIAFSEYSVAWSPLVSSSSRTERTRTCSYGLWILLVASVVLALSASGEYAGIVERCSSSTAIKVEGNVSVVTV